MIVNLYTVWDSVAEDGGPLFQAKNDAVAYRMFQNMLKSEKVYVAEDYRLINCATYNTETSEVFGNEKYYEVTAKKVMEVEDNESGV